MLPGVAVIFVGPTDPVLTLALVPCISIAVWYAHEINTCRECNNMLHLERVLQMLSRAQTFFSKTSSPMHTVAR